MITDQQFKNLQKFDRCLTVHDDWVTFLEHHEDRMAESPFMTVLAHCTNEKGGHGHYCQEDIIKVAKAISQLTEPDLEQFQIATGNITRLFESTLLPLMDGYANNLLTYDFETNTGRTYMVSIQETTPKRVEAR